MRSLFSGFYLPSDEEFKELWNECIFILDANVLLNLYRYPQQARDDLLNVLRKISDRLWIPYQVALEYQENRLQVIAEQIEKFDAVRKVLTTTEEALRRGFEPLQLSRRHPVIRTDSFLKRVANAFNSFKAELAELEKKQPDVYDVDKLRDEIDALVGGNIGSPPVSQKELDKIYEEGQVRYKRKQPPGFLDEGKNGQEEDDSYIYNGLCFKRKYGDLILWYQIIGEAQKREDFKKILFITDDDKEDWWWIVESKGEKTISPRPELVDEIRSKAGVKLFYMYNSERFMEYTEQYLGIKIEKESIAQVRDWARLSSEAELWKPRTWQPRLQPYVWQPMQKEMASETERTNVQSAVLAMMIDNKLKIIHNPVDEPTNDMSAFPDATSIAGSKYKRYDPKGNAYTAGDKDGYVLYQHDIIADGSDKTTVNYVASRYTRGTYTVDILGKVTQVTTGYE